MGRYVVGLLLRHYRYVVVVGLIDGGEDILYAALYPLRRDAVLPVVRRLNFPPSLRLTDCPLHRSGHLIRVHDDHSVHVSCRPPAGLNEGALGAEESLLVGVEDGHQRDLRQVKPLPQEIDTDENIEFAEPQVS